MAIFNLAGPVFHFFEAVNPIYCYFTFGKKIFFLTTFPFWLLVLPVAYHPYIHGLSNTNSDKTAVKREFNDVIENLISSFASCSIRWYPTYQIRRCYIPKIRNGV
jgi:hypothetical protein